MSLIYDIHDSDGRPKTTQGLYLTRPQTQDRHKLRGASMWGKRDTHGIYETVLEEKERRGNGLEGEGDGEFEEEEEAAPGEIYDYIEGVGLGEEEGFDDGNHWSVDGGEVGRESEGGHDDGMSALERYAFDAEETTNAAGMGDSGLRGGEGEGGGGGGGFSDANRREGALNLTTKEKISMNRQRQAAMRGRLTEQSKDSCLISTGTYVCMYRWIDR
jgi:hypothetical protein